MESVIILLALGCAAVFGISPTTFGSCLKEYGVHYSDDYQKFYKPKDNYCILACYYKLNNIMNPDGTIPESQLENIKFTEDKEAIRKAHDECKRKTHCDLVECMRKKSNISS